MLFDRPTGDDGKEKLILKTGSSGIEKVPSLLRSLFRFSDSSIRICLDLFPCSSLCFLNIVWFSGFKKSSSFIYLYLLLFFLLFRPFWRRLLFLLFRFLLFRFLALPVVFFPTPSFFL